MNNATTATTTSAGSVIGRRVLRARTATAAFAVAGLVGMLGVPAAAAAPPIASSAGAGQVSQRADTDEALASEEDLARRWFVDFFGVSPQDYSFGRDTHDVVQHLRVGTPKAEILRTAVSGSRYAQAAVERVYDHLLGRELDPGAQYWTDNVPRGMAVEWVEQNVMASPEYVGRARTTSWVADHLYPDVLGRPGSFAEGAYWASRVPQLGRLGVVRAIWYSPEGVGGRVADNYAELLDRNPSPAEVDYWRASQTRSDLDTRLAIAASPEYARALPPGTHRVTADVRAAGDFLDAVAYGRWELAYALLTPRSQAALGGPDALAARTDVTGGMARLSKVARRDRSATIVEGRATAVVVAGSVRRASGSTFAATSVGTGVTDEDITPRVDLVTAPVGLLLEPADRRLDAGEPITLTVDRAGRSARVAVVVDGQLVDLPDDAGRTQDVITVPAPAQGWSRRSVITTVARFDDGQLQTRSTVFTSW